MEMNIDHFVKTVTIVHGYHAYWPVPDIATSNRLTSRIAVVLPTHDVEKGEMVYRAEDVDTVLSIVGSAMGSQVQIRVFESGLVSASKPGYTSDEDRLQTAQFFDEVGRLVAFAEHEPWTAIGGPFPYHDSCTLSFYVRSGQALVSEKLKEQLPQLIKREIELQEEYGSEMPNIEPEKTTLLQRLRKYLVNAFHATPTK